jgi:hypothetical protein
VALSRQSAPPAAPDGRACNGAAGGGAPAGRIWAGAARSFGARPAERVQRRSAAAVPSSCGPASGNISTCSRRTVATVGRRFRDRCIRPPLNPAPPCNPAGFSLLFALGRSSSNTLWRHRRRRRPSGPHMSLLRRQTSGARATAIGRCGPFLLWAGIWKRFHMFTTGDPELARSPRR